MAEVEITTELQEIQSNLWGVNVRENIALALEKLQNLPEELNPIQGSLNLSLLDTASWKLGLLKNSIQGKEDTLQSRKDQLDRIKAKLEQVSGRTILQYGQCGDDVYYAICDDGEAALYGTGATYDYTFHDSVFYQNGQIKKIVLSNGITGLGDRLFYHCANAETISLPATLTSIGDSAFAQEDAAIGYTAGLTSVTIPQAVTAIQSYAFYHTAIAEVTVPASVKTWGKYAFSGCAKLKTARVACDSIGAFAFTRCTALSSLTISANCRTFGENMLTYCESLTAITYEETIAQWNAITKPVNWMSSGKHSYNNYLKKIQCVDGYLEYDPENNVWNEVKNG
nr:MAG: BspA type Leucine rich repeat region protein [Bacteriophage sp.]